MVVFGRDNDQRIRPIHVCREVRVFGRLSRVVCWQGQFGYVDEIGLDPRTFAWEYDVALGHFCAGRYDDAVLWGEKSLRDMPNFGGALRLAAASYALVGRFADANKMMVRLRELSPELRVSLLDDVMPPFRRVEDRAQYLEGLRRAGLPE